MELRHCRYFVAVAEELHFGRAAKRLGISQPPLSQQIRALEVEIGVELLRRTKRNVRLTPAGEVFLQSSRKLLRDVEDSLDVTRRASRGEVGSLQLGYAPGAEIELLPRVVRAFYRKYPDVDVRLVPLHTREQIESLKQGRIDAGLLLLPAAAEGLEIRTLRREPLVVVLPREHPLARRSEIRPRDLAGVAFIHLSRDHAPLLHDQVLALARQAGISLRVVCESAHLYDALSLSAAGVGVCLLPDVVRRIRCPGTVFRPLRGPKAEVEFGLAYRGKELSQATLEFVRVALGSARRG